MPVRPLPRKINRAALGLAPKPLTSEERAREASRAVERSHAKVIYEMVPEQREVIIDAIRDGASMQSIAAFAGDQGWIRVTEKTFIQSLYAFRKLYPDLVKATDPDERKNLNGIVDKRRPALDEENSLEQLVRVQSIRIRTAIDFEQESGMPFPNLHKDVEITRNLIESLANLRGRGAKSDKPGKHAPMSNEAQEQLRMADRSEASADKLSNLVDRLGAVSKKTVENGQTS